MLPSGGAAPPVALLVGCGGGAAMGGGAAVMMYAVPDGNPLTYERTDSMAISIEVPGRGSLTLHVDQAMTLGVGFEPSASGVQVRTKVERLSARMTNPLAAPTTLSESDIEGDLVHEVRRGGCDRLRRGHLGGHLDPHRRYRRGRQKVVPGHNGGRCHYRVDG